MATQGKTIAETPHVCRVCFAPGHANYTCDLRFVVEKRKNIREKRKTKKKQKSDTSQNHCLNQYFL